MVAATDQTLRRLARMPGLGTLWDSDKPRLTAVRFFPITKFRNRLVFYRERKDGIELVRVLHGARDIEAIFAGEE